MQLRILPYGIRIFLRCSFVAKDNCYYTKTMQHSSWSCITSCCRSMCTKVQKDPDCKQPLFDPVKGDLVYAGKISKMVVLAKGLSLTTCSLGIAFQPYLYLNAASFTVPLLVAMGGSLGFFMFVTTGIIQVITKQYITDIFYDRKTENFTAGRITFFLRRKEIKYTAKDVEVPLTPKMFATIKIHGKPYFVDENNWKDYDVYLKMLGYDEPLDLDKYKNKKE